MSALVCWAAMLGAVINVANEHALRDALVSLASERLSERGLILDAGGASLQLSRPLAGPIAVEVRAAWLDGESLPALPLQFQLQRIGESGEPVLASLAVAVRREVWVASRRLRKGSPVKCEDLRKALRRGSADDDLPVRLCELAPDAVALQELSEGDVVRKADVGSAPAVMAGEPVRLSVVANGIRVTTSATALSDARTGEPVDVRLTRSRKVVSARVTGTGTVELLERTP
jgi:flagella basal body P-ring formation protein FlgA